MVGSPFRRLLPAALLGLALLGTGVPPLAADDELRIGVLYHRDDVDVAAALAGLRDGLRLAGRDAVWVEADARGDAASGRIALEGLRIEGVEVVVAVGERASQLVARGKLDRPVLCTALSDVEVVLGAGGRGLPGTTSHLSPDDVLGHLRAARPAWTRLGLVVGAEDSHTRRRAERVRDAALRRDGGRGLERDVRLVADTTGTPRERAEQLAEALRDRQVVWIERDVDAEVVDQLTRLAGDTGTVFLGTRRSHLDAGCPVVLRPDAESQGRRAAGVLARLLAGEAAERIGFVDAGSHRLEINLTAAERAGVQLPLPLLAAADRIRQTPRRAR